MPEAKPPEGEKIVGDQKYGYFEGCDGSIHYFPAEDRQMRRVAMKGAQQSSGSAGRRQQTGMSRSGKSP